MKLYQTETMEQQLTEALEGYRRAHADLGWKIALLEQVLGPTGVADDPPPLNGDTIAGRTLELFTSIARPMRLKEVAERLLQAEVPKDSARSVIRYLKRRGKVVHSPDGYTLAPRLRDESAVSAVGDVTACARKARRNRNRRV